MQIYPNRFSVSAQTPLANFYLIFGDEPQQKLDCIERIRQAAAAQGFDERQSLQADTQFNWDKLIEASQTLSLFSSRQIIELELPTGKPGTSGSKVLASLASQPNPDVLFVIHGGKIGKDVQNTKWFKALDKLGVYVPCYPLEGNALYQWVNQGMAAAGLAPSQQITQLLVDYCEGNLLAAKQEIEKLSLLFPNGNPELKEVEQAVVDQSRYTVFHLIDVLLAGESQRAVKMLFRLESEGVEPNILLWALSKEWQTLSALQFDKSQGQAINWNQHRIWKNRQRLYNAALSRLSNEHLLAMQGKLSEVDQALKQSSIARPYVELCHLCLLFVPFPLSSLPLDYPNIQ